MTKLEWDGLANARDLSGIPLRGGGLTTGGAYVRSDHPSRLTEAGWEQLEAYGIRTIVSLETGGLKGQEALRANRPVEVPHGIGAVVRRVPVEDGSDAGFMDQWARTGLWGTPLYFKDALERWPGLYGAALNEIVDSEGPVLLHCGRGHDRTGIICLLLLSLAGATAEGITADYLLSSSNLQAHEPRSVELLHAALRDAGTTALEAVESALSAVTGEWLRAAGVRDDVPRAVRTTLCGG